MSDLKRQFRSIQKRIKSKETAWPQYPQPESPIRENLSNGSNLATRVAVNLPLADEHIAMAAVLDP